MDDRKAASIRVSTSCLSRIINIRGNLTPISTVPLLRVCTMKARHRSFTASRRGQAEHPHKASIPVDAW